MSYLNHSSRLLLAFLLCSGALLTGCNAAHEEAVRLNLPALRGNPQANSTEGNLTGLKPAFHSPFAKHSHATRTLGNLRFPETSRHPLHRAS